MKHFLSVDQLTKKKIQKLFDLADYFRNQDHKGGRGAFKRNLKDKIVTNLFYEPSTRTSSSFQAAAYKLGADVISINEVRYSSVSKGETLHDTIKTFESYSDAIVLRHPDVGSAKTAAESSNIPIINAGDGIGEHPSQSLLDLYTIKREHGHIDNLEISMVGDLKHGRTVHSLVKLLRLYNTKINFVSPTELNIPDTYIKPNDFQTNVLEAVVASSDVVYMTRVQKERIEGKHEFSYGIDQHAMKLSKKSMILMHPLPRNEEIPISLDNDPRSAYFRQMKNGLYIRMAILNHLMND